MSDPELRKELERVHGLQDVRATPRHATPRHTPTVTRRLRPVSISHSLTHVRAPVRPTRHFLCRRIQVPEGRELYVLAYCWKQQGGHSYLHLATHRGFQGVALAILNSS